jgi:hypothetical protein
MSEPKYNGHAGPATLSPEQEAELRAYRQQRPDKPTIRELQELQEAINELLVAYWSRR